MSTVLDRRARAKGLLSGMLQQVKSRVDPLVAPYLPERFYDRYGQQLAMDVYRLPVLDGLPEATIESGLAPLRLIDGAGTIFRPWDVITQSSRVLITGPVGSGKSTALRLLAWRFLARPDEALNQFLTFKLFKESRSRLRPVLVDLRQLGQQNLFDAVLDSLSRFGFPIPHDFFVHQLEAGEVVLLLDHWDAVHDPRQRAQLAELLAAYPRNLCVVAARAGVGQNGLAGFADYTMLGLEQDGIEPYIHANLGEHSSAARGLMAASERSTSFAQLMSLPLMLAAMCKSLRIHATQAPRLSPLLNGCLTVLLEEWPERSGRSTSFSQDVRSAVLERTAYEMQCLGAEALTRDVWLAHCREGLGASPAGNAEELLDSLALDAGVLRPSADEDDGICFTSSLLRSYLAARHVAITDGAQTLMDQLQNPRWRDSVILLSDLISEPFHFLDSVNARAEEGPDKWLLLAACISEIETFDARLVDQVIEHLFGILEGDEETLWSAAATSIAGMARRRTRDHFSSLIRDPDSAETRRRAALAMGRLGAQWAVPSLGAAISDDEPLVRQEAAWALGHIPSPQVVHVLPRALRSPHKGVREAAAQALARQARSPDLLDSVVSVLLTALDDEREAPETVAAAARALEQIGGAATQQLMTALGSRRLRAGQRSRVARTLGLLGDDRALPVLVNAILTDPPDQTEGYVEAIACIGAAAVAPLIKALEGRDITTSGGVIQALARIGAPAIAPLLEAIAASSPEVRRSAVHALSEIGAPAVESLTHAMLHDARFEVRRRALEILGNIGEAHVGATLVDALEDPDPGVRMHAVRYIGNLRYAEATPALIKILHNHDEDQTLRREVINSLSAIGDERAIPSLLQAIDEQPLLEAARNALVEYGERVVAALVEALYTTTNPERQSVVWGTLEQIGQRGRPEDPSPLGLARVYSILRTAGPDKERILSLTSHLDWWEHGRELHDSLATAHEGAAIANLRELSEFGDALSWLAEIDVWLRPHVREILWGLRDIVEDISLYHKITRRDAQRDALLSGIDRLEEVRELCTTMALPFEQIFIEPLISRWHELMIETTKQLRGRASLLIRLLTPRLALRDPKQRTTAVFSLFNEGDSAARALSVTLRSVDIQGNGLRIVREEHHLDPLGIGEERQVEIPLVTGGAHNAELLLVAHYDDDDRQRVSERLSCRIEFYAAPQSYTAIEQNPYIVGMPVRESQMFFGRQDIFEWVRENISGKYQEQPLLLYGERRMGKTSVLYQLQTHPPTPQHICLLFDLQLYGYATTVHELLFELASAITTHLSRQGLEMDYPDWDAFQANPHRAFLNYADILDEHLSDRRIVIMMDEFGVLMDKVRNGTFDTSIFDYLRGITQRSQHFTFIFTGAYEVRRMQQDFASILFNMPKVRKISYLSDGEATDLIVEPMRGLIEYHPLVIQRIRNVTACHPYFIQYICQELVRLAQDEQRNYIELTDVDIVIQDVVRDATGNIENSIYNDLSDSEKLVLAALAHVTDEVRVFVLLGDIASMLERRRLGMPREDILQALKTLRERDLATETRIGQQLRYSFRMGLVRLWLRENEMLLRLAQQQEREV